MSTSPIAERIKAEALRLMAEHAAIAPRGWDAQRQRTALHHQIDAELDKWSLETLLWCESVPRTA